MSTTQSTRESEQIRQLKAARDGRYLRNVTGRYLIEGEDRPARRERERLMGLGLLDWRFGLNGVIGMTITSDGRAALLALEAGDA